MMTSSATVPATPTSASEATYGILQDMGYKPVDCRPGDPELTITASRKFLRAELHGAVSITEHQGGSTLEVMIQTAPYETSGILDGRRNQKSVDELTARIFSTLGTQSGR